MQNIVLHSNVQNSGIYKLTASTLRDILKTTDKFQKHAYQCPLFSVAIPPVSVQNPGGNISLDIIPEIPEWQRYVVPHEGLRLYLDAMNTCAGDMFMRSAIRELVRFIGICQTKAKAQENALLNSRTDADFTTVCVQTDGYAQMMDYVGMVCAPKDNIYMVYSNNKLFVRTGDYEMIKKTILTDILDLYGDRNTFYISDDNRFTFDQMVTFGYFNTGPPYKRLYEKLHEGSPLGAPAWSSDEDKLALHKKIEYWFGKHERPNILLDKNYYVMCILDIVMNTKCFYWNIGECSENKMYKPTAAQNRMNGGEELFRVTCDLETGTGNPSEVNNTKFIRVITGV